MPPQQAIEHLLPQELPEEGRVALEGPVVAAVDTAARHFLPDGARPGEGAGALTACLFKLSAYSVRADSREEAADGEVGAIRVSFTFERERACPGVPGEVYFPQPSSYLIWRSTTVTHYEGTPWLGWAPGVTSRMEPPEEAGVRLSGEGLVALRLVVDDLLPTPDSAHAKEDSRARCPRRRDSWDVAMAPGRLPDGHAATFVSLRRTGGAACAKSGRTGEPSMYAVDTRSGRIIASR